MTKILALLVMFGTIVFSNPLSSEAGFSVGGSWGSEALLDCRSNFCGPNCGDENSTVPLCILPKAFKVNGDTLSVRIPLVMADDITPIYVCDDIDCGVLTRDGTSVSPRTGKTWTQFIKSSDYYRLLFYHGEEYDFESQRFESQRVGRQNVEYVYLDVSYVKMQEKIDITVEFQLYNCPSDMVITSFPLPNGCEIDPTAIESDILDLKNTIIEMDSETGYFTDANKEQLTYYLDKAIEYLYKEEYDINYQVARRINIVIRTIEKMHDHGRLTKAEKSSLVQPATDLNFSLGY